MLRLPLLISFQRNPRPLINTSRPLLSSFLSLAALSFGIGAPVQKMALHSSVVIIGSGKTLFPNLFPPFESFLLTIQRSRWSYCSSLPRTRRTETCAVRRFPRKRNRSRWTAYNNHRCRKLPWVPERNHGSRTHGQDERTV